MKKLILSLLLIVSLALFAPLLHADGLRFEEGTVLESGTIEAGVSYRELTGTSYTDAGTPGSQHIAHVTMDKDEGMLIPWSLLTMSGLSSGTVVNIANDFMAQHPGYKVLAAINGDYYNMTTGEPVNALAQNGRVIKPDNFYLDRYFSLGFDDDRVIANKTNETMDDYVIGLYDENGRMYKEFFLEGFNTLPSETGITAYFGLINEPVTEDAFLYKGDIRFHTEYTQHYMLTKNLTSETEVSLNPYDVTVSFRNDQLLPLFNDAAYIEIQKPFTGVYDGIGNVIGVGSKPLEDNVIKPFEDINDQSVSFAQTRHPRTSLGFTAEGDVIFLAADGRQPGMDGVNLREEAVIMQHLGAVNTYNFDGGGSTQLAVHDGVGLRLLNSPSETSVRRVSNALLFVKPVVDVELNVHELTESDVTFSYQIGDTDVTINDVHIYLDDDLLDVSEGVNETVSGLSDEGIHRLAVEVTYTQGQSTHTICFANRRLNMSDAEGNTGSTEPVFPSDFDLSFDDDDSTEGFTVTVDFNDPDNRLVKMYLLYGDERDIVSKTVNGYQVEIENATPDHEYVFELEYHYRSGSVTPAIEVLDESFSYHFQPVDDEPGGNENDPEEEGDGLSTGLIIGLSAGVVVLLVVIGIVIKHNVKKP